MSPEQIAGHTDAAWEFRVGHVSRSSIVAVAVALSSGLSAAPAPAARGVLPSELPGSTLPVVHEHTYKMSGRVRMLFLWIGRDDVGSGVIRWRGAEEEGDYAYELLIGSDPLRAPGKLNRWGYLAEEVQDGECAVVGVMSKSTETGLSEVKAGLKQQAAGRPFDTIRGRVTPSQAFARVTTIEAAGNVSYREADAVLGLALGASVDGMKQIERPSGTRPGFLSSVAEMIRESVASNAKGQRLAAQTIPYIYGDRLYELRLLDATPLTRFERDGRTYEDVIRGRFETGRPGHSGSRFELVYGTSGPFAEIPILISYQPKWWLQVELEIQ
jgi:hypothetical protein